MPFKRLNRNDQLGFLLACAYAFFAFSIADIAHVCAMLMLVIVIVSRRFSFRVTKKDNLHWLLLLSIAIPIISWLWGSLSGSPFQSNYPQKLEYIPKLFLFMLVAYFIRYSNRHIIIFGTTFVAGLLLSPIISGHGYTPIVHQIINDQRVSLGTINTICVSATFAIAIIFSLTELLPRILKLKHHRSLAIIAFALLFFVLALIVITTQTRGVFLGLAACLGVAIFHLIGRASSKRLTLPPLLLVIGLSGWYFASSDQFTVRFERSLVAVDTLLTEGLSSVPQSSTGQRIHMWAAGLDAFSNSPILGHGGHAAKGIIQAAPYMTEYYKNANSHLHNTYIDLLARFGIIGLLWYLALLTFIYKCATQAHRDGVMGKGMYQFTIYFLVFWLVINLFESFAFISRGPVIFTIAIAMVYAYRYRMALSTATSTQSNTSTRVTVVS